MFWCNIPPNCNNVYQVGSDTALSDSLRVKALSCIAFLIKLKSKVKHECYILIFSMNL